MSRSMARESFRREHYERRYAPNVQGLNEYVDTLGGNHGSVPYIDPDCGGSAAEVLLLLQDPGPKSGGPDGASGFLSVENDDPTAEAMGNLLHEAGLSWSRCIPWNVVPWYVAGNLTPTDKQRGLKYLHELRALLPSLRVVVLFGGVAQDAWKQYRVRYGDDVRGLEPFDSLHTSNRGLTRGSRQLKTEGWAQTVQVFHDVVAYLDRATNGA